MKTRSFIGQPRGRQSGAALLVVLMLLVVITLLGLASMRGAIMQERMATNITARSRAFQVAEAGLRQAEIIARDGTLAFPAAAGCSAGRCAMVLPPAVPAWTADGFWNDGQTGFQEGAAVPVGPISVKPKFVIENFGTTTSGVGGGSECVDMSKPCIGVASQSVYRITAYAAMPNGDGEVIVQSLYRR
ncbi:pilus assembly PilX family protein [Cognatilysobacter segetis]|uniref:pilus assembly PilX family protein n=1 Tax=Cognatilysobacter segetis TaxID=2492394 RepID=UPI00105EE0FD|nr:PilX N-terminal domain-containing pilus assembly protein [Lysobacter segetis]